MDCHLLFTCYSEGKPVKYLQKYGFCTNSLDNVQKVQTNGPIKSKRISYRNRRSCRHWFATLRDANLRSYNSQKFFSDKNHTLSKIVKRNENDWTEISYRIQLWKTELNHYINNDQLPSPLLYLTLTHHIYACWTPIHILVYALQIRTLLNACTHSNCNIYCRMQSDIFSHITYPMLSQ